MVEISVEPAHKSQKEQPKLTELIARITQERGNFTNLKESTLESNAASELDNQTPSSPTTPPEELNTPTFQELRSDLASNIAQALNEAALNLDFVSLLVSSTRQDAGLSTMSPALKQQLTPGSLNSSNTKIPAPATPPTSGYEWKINAYKQASEFFKAGYERLENEVQLESTFWKDMLQAVLHGEVINRKLQVKYGYKDSGSHYFHPGVGQISRDSTGHAQFQPTRTQLDTLVQVKVFLENNLETNSDPFVLVGTAAVDTKHTEHPTKLINSIQKERQMLFQNELMYQLIQEVRTDLGSLQVCLNEDGKITCMILGGKIEIQQIEFNEEVLNSSKDLNNPAVSIAYALQLLLTSHFKSQLNNVQSNVQVLKSYNDHQPVEVRILRPVLGHIQHSILVQRTLKLLHISLPNASFEVQHKHVENLDDEPYCDIKINAENGFVLRVGSPIDNKRPDFKVTSVNSKFENVEFYGLLELEQWLRWISQ